MFISVSDSCQSLIVFKVVWNHRDQEKRHGWVIFFQGQGILFSSGTIKGDNVSMLRLEEHKSRDEMNAV